MYYLYRSAPHGATSFDLGNPDLKPERMRYSVEAGHDIYVSDKAEISVTGYASSFEDFLDKVNIDPADVPSYFSPGQGVSVRQSVNIGEVSLYGAEMSLRHQLHPTSTLILGYSYTRSEIREYETDPTLVGNALEDNPEHIANLGFQFSSPKLFTAGFWLKYVGERFSDMENTVENIVDAYPLVSLNVSRSFLKNRLTVSFAVDNLLDEQYYGYYGSKTRYYYGPARSFTGGLSFKL
jgi:iron complex outermembrane receptor protein